MIALIVYGVVVGLLVLAAGRAGESLARSAARPVRWIWFGAMVATVGFSFAAASRAVDAGAGSAGNLLPRMVSVSPADVVVHQSWLDRVTAIARDTQRPLNDAIVRLAGAAQHVVPANVQRLALIVWGIVGAALVIVFFAVQRRMRRARMAWPLTDIAGARVRLSPEVGPLVAGVVRPEIVVPRWILERHADEQRMVVAHEGEHVRAHDPALLGAACVALAAMPWNPALWYMFSRLRLAVELDCDARVLRGGSTPGRYGALLIDVAERASPIRLNALALADDSSHLHQRILAMKPERARFALVRGGIAVSLGLVALLAACAAEMPTAADIQQMDATTATASAKKFAVVPDTGIEYVVDGKPMRAEQARAIAPSDIERIEVKKAPSHGQVLIYTKGHYSPADTAVASGRRVVALTVDGKADTMITLRKPGQLLLRKQGLDETQQPVIYVDGVRAGTGFGAIQSLDRTKILSVDVIKGAAAVKTYGPEAQAGVILIKTKSGGSD